MDACTYQRRDEPRIPPEQPIPIENVLSPLNFPAKVLACINKSQSVSRSVLTVTYRSLGDLENLEIVLHLHVLFINVLAALVDLSYYLVLFFISIYSILYHIVYYYYLIEMDIFAFSFSVSCR